MSQFHLILSLLFVFSSLQAHSQSHEGNIKTPGMICEPREVSDFPTDLVANEMLFFGAGIERYLQISLKGKTHVVKMTAFSATEFMGTLEGYSVFFEQDEGSLVKMLVTLVNFETMDSIGPLKINCYLDM